MAPVLFLTEKLAEANREIERLRREYEEAAEAHGRILEEIERLRARLEQIAIVCTDNMDRDCNHRMALDFARQIANEQNGDDK